MPSIQKIFYGPPGTGKTWRAAREAVRAVSPGTYEWAQQQADPESALSDAHRRLVHEGTIVWVTFHPTYSYEDFVEGYRPIVDNSGQLSYQVLDGPFKQICVRARAETDLQIGEQLRDANGNAAGQVVDKDAGGWLIRITPNRADEVAAEQYKYVSRLILHRFMDAGLPPTVFSIPGAALISLHDFGLNETDPDVPPPNAAANETTGVRNGSVVRRVVGGRAHVSSSDLANSSHYGAVYRRLRELATGGEPSPVAMVIDEINRADLSRVFGELLTLLESDKREGMPEERRIFLPYSKTLFTVPANVSVIGTMNTVDRSLTAMDFAMRRRFEFELVDAEPAQIPADYDGVNLQRVLIAINRRISVLLGDEYRIGHACLMTKSLARAAVQCGWQNLGDASLRSIAHTWRSYVLPTLLEYFHSDWQKARAVAGFVPAGNAGLDLFESIRPDEALMRLLPDEYDLPDARSFSLASWWDPSSPAWDPNMFREFLRGLANED
jgi:5-methylcytosine-specific restriction enzyme B